MNYQRGFETLREATKYMFETPSLSDVLFVLSGFSLAVGLLIALPYWWSKHRAKLERKKEFFTAGKTLGLSEGELSLLWGCARVVKEPIKALQNKAVFEKCVNKLVREDLSRIESISQIRKKLRFDSLPWFLPLTTTKDIDLYQTGFVTFEKLAYSSAVWEKSELELHLALLDLPKEEIKAGSRVKFSFIREGDGRYYFQGEVLRTYQEGSKLILILPHTDQLSKIQLRNSLRWRVKIPAKVYIRSDATSSPFEVPENTLEGIVEDLSTQGVKVCFQSFVEVRVEDKIYIEFQLRAQTIKVTGSVKNIRGGAEKTCIGVKFINLSKWDEDHIRKFITDEQRELLKAYKMGETKGGFSSSGL
ncbi:MAG: PilZ domain-containing protein [Aquificaceae bacterium]|nr:PilZ domain-containing protein [Aquificaceae bacterium]MDW8294732.1 PilZ domain-containing protein [Aquificaceae bacterium]